jgi:hypothetical protein
MDPYNGRGFNKRLIRFLKEGRPFNKRLIRFLKEGRPFNKVPEGRKTI